MAKRFTIEERFFNEKGNLEIKEIKRFEYEEEHETITKMDAVEFFVEEVNKRIWVDKDVVTSIAMPTHINFSRGRDKSAYTLALSSGWYAQR